MFQSALGLFGSLEIYRVPNTLAKVFKNAILYTEYGMTTFGLLNKSFAESLLWHPAVHRVFYGGFDY